MRYRQEYYRGEAEDNGEVLSTAEMAEVPAGLYRGALLTKDTITIEPDVQEYKLYARGVGPVLVLGVSGGSGREELVKVDQAPPDAGTGPLGRPEPVELAPSGAMEWKSGALRVLVVEDEAKLADLLRRGLTAHGLAVDVAATGEDALWMAPATAYQVIVLDLMLPDVDGVEVCRRLTGGRRADPDPDADRAGRAAPTGWPGWTAAPTTTWASRSPWPS